MQLTPVLVAGAGVAGCLVALELARHDVPSIVVERAARPPRHPDLLLINGGGMASLRRLGLADEIRRHGVDPECPTDIVWSRGPHHPPVLVSRLPSPHERRLAYAKQPYLLISGPELTGRLRAALIDHPLIDLRTGWTLTDVRPAPGATAATVIEAATGARHVVEARYLAGCDGAQSTVRRCLGVPMTMHRPGSQQLTVYFRSPGLTRRTIHPTVLIAAGLTVLLGHDGDRCIAHLPSIPDDTITDPAALLRERLGLAGEPPEITGVVQHEDAPGIAAAYRGGTAFLAGESAHRFDRLGGDADTCIGDAVDLGRRLAATITGGAGADRLDGYDGARRRHALLALELAERERQSRRRFARMVAAGTPNDDLVAVLEQEPPQLVLDAMTGHRQQDYENA